MKKKEFLIYALVDPRDDLIRYVGQSAIGIQRARQHLEPSELKLDTYKVRWIKTLLRLSMKPQIKVLERVNSVNELNPAEIKWIAEVKRTSGTKLTNATSGGGGAQGVSDETRAKMSASQKRAWAALSDDKKKAKRDKFLIERDKARKDPIRRREIIDSAVKGNKTSWANTKARESRIEKMSVVRTSAWSDETYKNNVTESNKRTWSDPVLRKKHSDLIKHKWSKNTHQRQKIVEANKLAWSDPARKAARSAAISAGMKRKKLETQNKGGPS